MDITDVLPSLGLRVTDGDLELRGVTDSDLPTLIEVVLAGVHDPTLMPFTFPWTDAPREELPLRFAQYHWLGRAGWSPQKWELNLGVWLDGRLVGIQGASAADYLVTRTVETGSWLGREHQGRGTGTRMRRMICALLFDHLDARWITSGYFRDNPSSAAVSRKVGYRDNGVEQRRRREGERAEIVHLLLTPEDFLRGDTAIEVQGLDAVRRSMGLPG
jgi:RimJ/RimL family protein N-acetyltransferase